MFIRRMFVAALAATLLPLNPSVALAASSGQPAAAEKPFVDAITADLNARFPSPEAARKAGYVQYTGEDETGAISYANRQWTSTDEKHPSQLWYDAKGRLLGADYSVPLGSAKPSLFGVAPERWEKFPAHVHYGLVGAAGTTYAATGVKKLVAVGASADHPTPIDLVKLGVAKNTSDVRFVFLFPAIWDLAVWIYPNPDGAFAEKNPNVKPSDPKPMAM